MADPAGRSTRPRPEAGRTSTRRAGRPPQGEPGRLDRFERWLAGHTAGIVAAIVVASAALRIVYFAQLAGGPLMLQHRWVQSDMHHFDEWAREIAAGDWLSADVDRPLHRWHRRVAEDYLRDRPDERRRIEAALLAEGDALEEAAARAVWDRWCGGGRLYQNPLYPYLVALTYVIMGEDVRWVFLWQLALGALGNVLLYLIARRSFGELAGVVAGVLAVLYAPLLFYEMILLRDSTVVAAGLAIVWLTGRALDEPSWRGWAATGLVMGLAVALKVHFALLALGIAGVLAGRSIRSGKALARWSLPLAAGFLVGFGPLVLRNLAVGVPPAAVTGGAPLFVLANGASAGAAAWDTEHMAAILGETEARMLPTVLATLGTHSGPGSYLGLLWDKVVALGHWYEYPNNENFYYYRLHASALRSLPVTFLLLAPLAFVGLVLGARDLRRAWPLYGLVLTYLVVLLFTLALSRFRIPLAAALIPFAGLTVASVVRGVAARRWVPAAATVVAAGVLAAWTAAPLPAHVTPIRRADCVVPFEVHYRPMVAEAVGRGDWDRAARVLEEVVVRRQPAAVRAMGEDRPARNAGEQALAELFAGWHHLLAEALAGSGEADAAARARRRADALQRASRP